MSGFLSSSAPGDQRSPPRPPSPRERFRPSGRCQAQTPSWRRPPGARGAARGSEPASLSANDSWVRIHPTPQTVLFREILFGELGYTEGQGVYCVVRSGEAAAKQLQTAVFSVLLNAAAYRDLEADWQNHVRARRLEPRNLAEKYRGPEETAAGVAERVFDTWRRTLYATLLSFAHDLVGCFTASGPNGPAGFARYIDWICCLGVVPILRNQRRGDVTARTCALLRGHPLVTEGRLTTITNAVGRCGPRLLEMAAAFDAVTVPTYDRTEIFYDHRRGELRMRDAVSGQRGECWVLWAPFYDNGRVLFDSPMQRLSREVVACHMLREHARVCRLINTAPVRVLLGRKSDDERGGAARAVSRALGEDADKSGSAASRLVRLIINMKNMRHVGDINDTIRAYLDEAGGHLLDNFGGPVDQGLPGFGRTGGPRSSPRVASPSAGSVSGQRIQKAFQTSVVNSINGMLEGYINNLFGTIERLRETNHGLSARLRDREQELARVRASALDRRQREADADPICEGEAASRGAPTPHSSRVDCDVIDVSSAMGDDTYVANSFQHQYVPTYAADLERLSRLWEFELTRCFQISRKTNNQGMETSISYSTSAVVVFVAPYFLSVIKTPHLGALITGADLLLGEEELWGSVFKKTRLDTYLADLAALFVADVSRAVAPACSEIDADGASPSRDRSRSPRGRRGRSRSPPRRRSGRSATPPPSRPPREARAARPGSGTKRRRSRVAPCARRQPCGARALEPGEDGP
ncbi:capsid portal protein [Saimiriine alphaherpesvirus 1]|uniref:Capsid portal protein n=1 Tax=Saimiriine herpesvirus 1 (strain MV-5-4-PSL) TaxID=10353 RepID=E2IUG4_SHV1|nr:capsid portal protein [Saimiriine alphaherpesvirus 1]ADO13822.1 capsid portal protein [Saimiriine alphaherpesvirus 1]